MKTGIVHESPRVLRYSLAWDTLELRQTFDGAEIVTGFTRVTERAFHWINEFPLNP